MKYIYIDDDKIEKSSDKVSGFIRENLSIDTQQHRGSWEEQINYICDSSNDIDGLILDLGWMICLMIMMNGHVLKGHPLPKKLGQDKKGMV